MDADRINAQAQSGNPAEANDPQSQRMAKMLRALERCFAENIRAELVENYNYADEESVSRGMRREYHLSDEILEHFYAAAEKIGAIERTERADGVTLRAADGYEPITYHESREANPATERGDYPVSHGSTAKASGPAVIFPESTTPANLCYDPQPRIKTVEYTSKSKQRKDEIDGWREDHSQHRRANLRIIARTADWSRAYSPGATIAADPLDAIRPVIEAQSKSGQSHKNAAKAENIRRRRKLDERKHNDLPNEDDGYVIPGCSRAADDEDEDPNEQGFVPSVMTEMKAASYTEAWDA